MLGTLKSSAKNLATAILERISPKKQRTYEDDSDMQVGTTRKGFIGLKRSRPQECVLEDDVPLDCLVTPPEKRLKQLNEDLSKTNIGKLHSFKEYLEKVRRWPSNFLWSYVVEGTVKQFDQKDTSMQSGRQRKHGDRAAERETARESTSKVIPTSVYDRHDYPSTSSRASITDNSFKENTRYGLQPRPSLHDKYIDVDILCQTPPSIYGRPSSLHGGPSSLHGLHDITKPESLLNQSTDGHPFKEYWRGHIKEHEKHNLSTTSRKTAFKKERVDPKTVFSFDRKDKDRRSKATTADSVVRLVERARYKELLAEYTSVTLPDYTSSIRADDDVETIKSSFMTERNTRYGSTITERTDAILSSLSSTLQPSSSSSYSAAENQTRTSSRTHRIKAIASPVKNRSTLRKESEDSVIDLTSSTSRYSLGKFNGVDEINKARNEKTPERITNVFDDDWTKKWRKLLDPVELERQRQIDVEERKLEELEEETEKRTSELLKRIDRRIDDEKTDKSDDFKPLTEEMQKRIKSALARGNSNECLVDAFNVPITRHDIATLADLNWLNDEIVNFYFNLLKDRANEPDHLNIHSFNSFFYPKLLKTGFSGVKRWTKKVDIFSMDLVILPVHLGMHWCLAAVDMRKKQIVYYDSLKGNNGQCIATIRKYLQEEHKDKKKSPLNFDGWTEVMPKDIPEQLNGCDCGVFACKYAEYLTRDVKFNFGQQHMPYFRKRMVYEILTKKLL